MDRTNKKLIMNMIYSGLGQLLILITPIITTPYVARIFSPSDIGLYSTSYALATFFVQFASFGIPIYGVRKIARAHNIEQRSRFFFETWFLQIVTTIISFFTYLICVYIFYNQSTIYMIQSLLILTNIFNISWFFIGIEEIKKNVYRNLLSKIVTLIAVFLFVKTTDDLSLYTFINIAGVLIGNFSMVLQLKPFINYKLSKKFALRKKEAAESFGLLVPQVVESAKNAVSRIILVFFSGYSESGFYEQGLKIVVVLGTVIQSITNAITPRMTSLLSENKRAEVIKIVERYVVLANILATIIVCGVMTVSDFFVPLFFGPKYLHVSVIMKISSVSLIFTTLSYFLGNGLLVSLSKDREYREANYFSAITLILGNLMLSNSLGSIGAGGSFVLSSFVLLCFIMYFLKNYIDLKNIVKQLFLSFLVILVTSTIVEVIKNMIVIENNFLGFIIFGSISFVFSFLCYFPTLLKVKKQ
ncbi:polysaccharide biosynthesis protein [Tetragenococcus halophilus subsp. flandriensis]|uniref:oligosaccharide flippase family protein n=1 Tax=Tetragenococcus halophilus TaxID=51669 RepID=UPI0023EA2432|nr:oligosaccharide flippase family protein [Tetragenococcus halophilus]GMA06953.1 polysaccharide biosynthesis protein [Tetragenococcus halophilus subsp. flandriensis]